ncbi:transporter, major facilitator family protein [Aeromicrobium marinum DSM 15272]|uniref:Transporter, major facilitator family protein n=1 Tax=Aeromicrobium marinum DSM 15272 TaxID=585531 RepID=E2SF64_9ACTN|nr:transporter, major facilitator family protein [Aeromicrobium marinum DSM 15272]
MMLVVGVVGQIAGTVAASAPTFLIPYLHLQEGLPLARAGALASAPLIGTMLTLVLWGVVVDRFGERLAMSAGLAVAAVAVLASATTDGYVALGLWWVLLGVGAASTNSASGRLVVGWFGPERRGTAMGIRQTALPLGVGLSAVIVPPLAAGPGLVTALLVVGTVAAVATVLSALLVVDPPRPDRQVARTDGLLDNPYRRRQGLWRIHAASALLVVPQYTVWTFMLVWLIDTRGWAPVAAGALVFSAQLLGAAGRIAAGWWTDRAGSRLRPMRLVAVGAVVVMVLLGALESTSLAVTVILVASVVTVVDNGMAFTAVAEIGGPFWSGRAMGMQNTGQYLAAAAVPPGVGAIIAGPGYAWAFALVAVFPLLAVPLVPVRAERPVADR